MTRRSITLIGSITVLVWSTLALSPGHAVGQAPTLRWSQQIDVDSAQDLPTGLLVNGTRVFTAIAGFSGPVDRWIVTAHKKADGTPLWADEIPIVIAPGEWPHAVSPLALAATGTRLVAVGILKGWAVRMYEAATGTVQWTDIIDWQRDRFVCNAAHAVHVNAQRVYVGGCVDAVPLIRAYTLDGVREWERFQGLDTTPRSVQSLHLSGTTLLAVHSDGSVQALRASTGEVLWHTDPVPNTRIRAAAMGQSKLALIGSQNSTWFLQVLSARTGHAVCSATGEGYATHVALNGEVYVAGGLHGRYTQVVVASYALDTCAVNWRTVSPERSGANEGENVANSLTLDVSHGWVIVGSALLSIGGGTSWPDALTVALSIVDGAEVWRLRQDGSAHVWDGVQELVASNGQLYSASVVNHRVRGQNGDALLQRHDTTAAQVAGR